MGSSDRDWRPTRFISLVLLFRFEPRLIVSPWLGHNQIFNITYDMVVTPGRWVLASKPVNWRYYVRNNENISARQSLESE